MTRNIQFKEKSQIPLAVSLLKYIELKEINRDTADLLLECICFLIIECGYKFLIIKDGTEKNYIYPKLVILDADSKRNYAMTLTAEFRNHILNKERIVLFDDKNIKIRSFN
jgi:hypothetical protein